LWFLSIGEGITRRTKNAWRVFGKGRGHHRRSRGIGREIAVDFARAGAQTMIVSSMAANLAAEKTIGATGGPTPVAIEADLRTLDGCKQVFNNVREKFNRCDILVCTVCATCAGNFVDLSDQAWMRGHPVSRC
jgi:3-oxoacyl-[acyl-carrier protein] reductase